MPSYQAVNRSYDRSMEMLGHSMMLASISEEQLLVVDDFQASSFNAGLKRASPLSKSHKTGLAELAAAQDQQMLMSQQQHQQPSSDEAWGFFLE